MYHLRSPVSVARLGIPRPLPLFMGTAGPNCQPINHKQDPQGYNFSSPSIYAANLIRLHVGVFGYFGVVLPGRCVQVVELFSTYWF